jgi:hypothetical protein
VMAVLLGLGSGSSGVTKPTPSPVRDSRIIPMPPPFIPPGR